MSRESAVTESISYRIEKCRVCESDVGLGTDIPEDELVKPGFAVLVGGGDVSTSEEHAGNWDVEVEFAGEQSDVNPPAVTGHILCVECAEAVHNHSTDNENYQGKLPDLLVSGTDTPNLPISDRALAVIVVVVVLFVILLIV
ncbi:hypothetical protein [Halogranum rubrum]|uniref:hypothetical protein n=1 Tax=Halogranum rubrum TaxID=553466 RepID=UPI0012F8BAA3|nr:hypothetical protein [Halogranum salarium]